MEPFKDRLFVGTKGSAPAIFNGTDCGICVATVTAFPWDPACTAPADYARLFAAAPEMLEALRAWQEVLVSMWGKHWPDTETARVASTAQTLTCAAIAKATGREP